MGILASPHYYHYAQWARSGSIVVTSLKIYFLTSFSFIQRQVLKNISKILKSLHLQYSKSIVLVTHISEAPRPPMDSVWRNYPIIHGGSLLWKNWLQGEDRGSDINEMVMVIFLQYYVMCVVVIVMLFGLSFCRGDNF